MEDPFREADDLTLIMEVLIDLRVKLNYVISLLEESDREAEEEDA